MVLKPVRTLAGWGLGVLFIDYTGYYIMDKTTPPGMALLVAVAPWVVYLAWRIITKSKLIEE